MSSASWNIFQLGETCILHADLTLTVECHGLNYFKISLSSLLISVFLQRRKMASTQEGNITLKSTSPSMLFLSYTQPYTQFYHVP